MILCSGGLSSSFFEKKLRVSFDAIGIQTNIIAKSFYEISEIIEEVDIVLIAPQISYQETEISRSCLEKRKKCLLIPARLYGGNACEEMRDSIIRTITK